MAIRAEMRVHFHFSWWLTGPCPHVVCPKCTCISGIILVRTGGVHLHTRGFTYSHLVPLSGTTQIAESAEPNYTSSEGFTYGIIVIGLGTAEPHKASLK